MIRQYLDPFTGLNWCILLSKRKMLYDISLRASRTDIYNSKSSKISHVRITSGWAFRDKVHEPCPATCVVSEGGFIDDETSFRLLCGLRSQSLTTDPSFFFVHSYHVTPPDVTIHDPSLIGVSLPNVPSTSRSPPDRSGPVTWSVVAR